MEENKYITLVSRADNAILNSRIPELAQSMLDDDRFRRVVNTGDFNTLSTAVHYALQTLHTTLNSQVVHLKNTFSQTNIILPSSTSTSPSLTNIACAFGLLVSTIRSHLYMRVLPLSVRQEVEKILNKNPSESLDAFKVIQSIDGIDESWAFKIKTLLDIADDIDLIRTYVLSIVFHLMAAIRTFQLTNDTDCSQLIEDISNATIATSNSLGSINSLVQQTIDGFLARPTESQICAVSSQIPTSPILLSSSHLMYELSALIKADRFPEFCPATSKPIEVDDFVAVESVLVKQERQISLLQSLPQPTMTLPQNLLQFPSDMYKMGMNGMGNVATIASENPSGSYEIADENDRGVSCHQCKSNKPKHLLLFCTTKAEGHRKRRCRKKYCDACLRRSYAQLISNMSSADLVRWQCPSCLRTCTCAACLRKNSQKGPMGQRPEPPSMPVYYNNRSSGAANAGPGAVNPANSPMAFMQQAAKAGAFFFPGGGRGAPFPFPFPAGNFPFNYAMRPPIPGGHMPGFPFVPNPSMLPPQLRGPWQQAQANNASANTSSNSVEKTEDNEPSDSHVNSQDDENTKGSDSNTTAINNLEHHSESTSPVSHV